jgi:hypothetical protein
MYHFGGIVVRHTEQAIVIGHIDSIGQHRCVGVYVRIPKRLKQGRAITLPWSI